MNKLGVNISVDVTAANKALGELAITKAEMIAIELPAALTIVNKQRELVPVDTSNTKNSIAPDIVESSGVMVVDNIGPSTNYAPSIEFGVTSKPNYPIQPFVRPSVFGNENAIRAAVSGAFKALLKSKGAI